MTSGKTRVGRSLAARIGWSHVDLDREIERAAGATIEEIFATEGEAGFRRLEVEISPQALEPERIVVSSGGGWITNPGLLETLPPDTLTVWLKVSPAEVARRLTHSRAQPARPLLREPDEERIRDLLARRTPMYERAALHIDTDRRSVGRIVTDIEERIRGRVPRSSNPES